MTWEQFRSSYKPGRYGRTAREDEVGRDADTLCRLLAIALARMDQRTKP